MRGERIDRATLPSPQPLPWTRESSVMGVMAKTQVWPTWRGIVVVWLSSNGVGQCTLVVG